MIPVMHDEELLAMDESGDGRLLLTSHRVVWHPDRLCFTLIVDLEDIAGVAAAVDGKTEMDAMIAYLQGLGIHIKTRR